MSFTTLFIIIGLIMISIALSSSVLQRLPLTTSILYLAVGIALGPYALGWINIDPIDNASTLEHLTEVAVIISLFTAGLKLRVPWRDPLWRTPVLLAFGSMALTVLLIAAAGMLLLDLSLGVAVLLGAVLAPTDPVLASDVQVTAPNDRNRLRFTLTAEAGLNDGSAFPLILLALGLIGEHELGALGWRWLAIDVLWAIPAGLFIGALFGTLIGRLVIYLRREHQEAIGLDDFLTLGLIALSYGIALLLHAYGFLAVFAAGLALRRIERQFTDEQDEEKFERLAAEKSEEEIATHPETAPAYLAQRLLGFNEHLERVGTVAVVILVGSLLTFEFMPANGIWIIPLLFLVIRPISALIGTIGSGLTMVQRGFISWFGIRGVGSVYYLMYAIDKGVPQPAAQEFVSLTLTIVATSVVIHGISVTPLMERFEESEREPGTPTTAST